MFCINCGKPVEDNDAFCFHCGASLEPAQPYSAANPQSKPEPDPVSKSEQKLAAMPEPKLEQKLETRLGSKPEEKSIPKPEIKSEPKREANSRQEAKPERAAKPQTAAKSERTANSQQTKPSQRSTQSTTKKPPIVPIVIVIAVVVVVIVLAALFGTGIIGGSSSSSTDNGATAETSAFAGAKVGDTYTFGSYEQDGDTSNGKEAIEWQVLAVENGKALLVSEKTLDCQPYNTSNASVTWSSCTLRTWLNDNFYAAAFTSDEQALIVETTPSGQEGAESGADNPDSSDKVSISNTSSLESDADKVFCLSADEAAKYFATNNDRMCAPTAYTLSQGAFQSPACFVNGVGTCNWWLRSLGDSATSAADVDTDGDVNEVGYDVDYTDIAVRPAMWVTM